LPTLISDRREYIKTPPKVFLRGGGEETRNRETEVVLVKIGGGNAVRVAPGRFSNLSDITNIATIMKRE
jgi:hypothetical protein